MQFECAVTGLQDSLLIPDHVQLARQKTTQSGCNDKQRRPNPSTWLKH